MQSGSFFNSFAARRGRLAKLAAAIVCAWSLCDQPSLAQQISADEQAAVLLAGARRGYQEGNYQFAADRFREFLQKFGGHKDANVARYGLGLALVEGPNKDYAAAVETLAAPANDASFANRAYALYYLGLAQRALATPHLAQAEAKLQEANQHRQAAAPKLEQAATQFAAAAVAFAARGPVATADNDALPADLQWAVRARCEQAEALLQLTRYPEARAATEQVLTDANLSRSVSGNWARYYYAQASFMLKDYQSAGKALGQLAPFQDPGLGLQARYLLARTHHLGGERAEAAAHYEAILAGYEEQKKQAPQLLQNIEAMKKNPAERTRLEAILRGPAPEFVTRTFFFAALVQFEEGKSSEAATRFAQFVQQHAQHALAADAQVRLGIAQVQLKQLPEGLKNLQPFLDNARLADLAVWWTARARIAGADPKNAPAYDQAVKTSIEELKRAADKANQIAASDPQARLRRIDIQLELADAQQLVKQFKEAAATYQQVAADTQPHGRGEEALQRQAAALHLAGQLNESDDVCRRFLQAYPRSTLLPAVQFRHAENAFLAAGAAATATPPNRDQEQRMLGEAIRRYQTIIDNYPEFSGVGLARQGLALSLYRLGKYEEAATILASIPESERVEDLTSVPYVLADCMLRAMPSDTSDALAAARVMQDLDEAIKLLGTYVGAQPTGPHAADALLKLGHCYQRVASILAEPTERTAALNNARQAYDKLTQQFANHPLQPTAVFQRAQCTLLAGDAGGATNELQRFTQDPLARSSIAPLALIRLSVLWRSQKKAAEAAAALSQFRGQQEGTLLADANRKAWVASLQYHQGLALKDAGKLPEARAVFEGLAKQFPAQPEAAEALWRGGQCRKEEALAKLEAARKILDNAGAKPEEKNTATASRDDGIKLLQAAAQYLHDTATQLASSGSAGAGEAQSGYLQLLYESAWCYRLLADIEIEAARIKLSQDALVKLQAEAAKLSPTSPAIPIAAPRPADIPLASVPVQPSELKAREKYQFLVAAAPDAPLAMDARLELAELLSTRDEFAPAMQLLGDAAAHELPADLAERVQLRLANCCLATDNLAEALASLEFILRNEKSPLAGEARYRMGEVYMRQQDWPAAIERLAAFRDQGPLQNLPAISDRALLRLGQALSQTKQWDASRQAYEALIGRFQQSPWVDEARYGIGLAYQNQNQHDQAVNHYSQVTQRTAAEVAARAQSQIGLCRLDQKKYAEAATALLVVPMTYNHAELSAMALTEAGRAYAEAKQADDAQRLWQRVVTDYPKSRWAEVAKDRLSQLKAIDLKSAAAK